MATPWQLVITALDGSQPHRETVVEADNWLAALRAGRRKWGDEGGVPPGASCVMSSAGDVTIVDASTQLRYELRKRRPRSQAPAAPAPQPRPAQPRAPSRADSAAAAPAQAPSRGDAGPAKVGRTATVAYSTEQTAHLRKALVERSAPPGGPATPKPSSLPPPSPLAAQARPGPQSQPSGSGASARGRAGERAAEKADAAAAGSSPSSAAPVRGTEPQSAAAAPAPSAASDTPKPAAAAGPQLLHKRDEQPTEERPLHYRERAFAVDPQTDEVGCEWLLREQLAKLREELSPKGKGKFVSIALFDHVWEGRPEKPPIATLKWKDWRGEPELRFAASATNAAWRAPSEAPPEASVPPDADAAPAAVAVPPAPDVPRLADTGEHDRRLAYAFEAAQDLYFLETPGDGVAFASRLLLDLVPCEIGRGLLYDINTDELREIVPPADDSEDAQPRAALPARRGLFSIAIASGLTVWVSLDVKADPRFKPELDTTAGVDPHNAMYIVVRDKDTLLGVLQLLNRREAQSFTEADKALAAYVADQLRSYLLDRRA